MKRLNISISIFFVLLMCNPFVQLNAQVDTLRVMTYNLLNFPASSGGREVYFKTVNQYLKADIILVNELSNTTGADIILNQALNTNGINYYNKADFVYGSNLNNILYYNSNKLTLYSQYEIETNVRDINEYVLYYNAEDLPSGSDTIFFYFYVAHLKANPGEEAERLAEVNTFLSRLNSLPNTENVFFCGDLNLYTSSELAYQALLDNTPTDFNDPLPAGNWHDYGETYSFYHTQSTRTRGFGDGSTGGLDDRFDFILYSDDVANNTNRVQYITGSCEAFGNDGLHYNDSLTDPPINPYIPVSITNALYYMSDHLPVIADFRVEAELDTTIAEIVITEIMYNPPEDYADTLEFIELYNNGPEPENIGGYEFTDDEGFVFIFPPVIINPGEYLVVAVNADAMMNTFGVSSLQWTSGALNNNGELILLRDVAGRAVDSILYDDSFPWPTETDGDGPSLVLCSPNLDNSLGGNWQASTNYAANNGSDDIFATPGFTECDFPPIAKLTANQTEIFTGESVVFSDLSINNPTSWNWTFEGGTPNSSSIQNPIISYNTIGTFDVTLVISNASGSDELILQDYISVFEEIQGNLMITEIMKNPGSPVDDGDGEWIEIFNPTNMDINLNGWTIKDNDSDVHTIEGILSVPAKGFIVMGINANSSVNGGYTCDYQYSNFLLGNGWDEIVLIAPDDSEIDRIEYDDNINWPDPNGASMVFTGSATDDNSNHSNWLTATLREPTFQGTSGDKGSPGTNGTGQNLITPNTDIELDLKVFLEGPFNGAMMNANLTGLIDFPLYQPYCGMPWNYSGTESVETIPANVIDWVLVELRDAAGAALADPDSFVAKKAAFVLNNGFVVDLDGSSNLLFNHSIIQSLFVVIWHRNHLGVMSANPLSESGGIFTYDFTTPQDQAYNSGQVYLAPGIWGMVSGDGDASGFIDSADKTVLWESQAGTTGYMSSDLNLDTQINNQDKNDFWLPNDGEGSQVPE